jgi:hypothetical protein
MSSDASAVHEPLFTEAEAAEILRVSVSTIRGLRLRKMIAFYRFGPKSDSFGRVFYSENHIRSFKQQSEQPASVAA